MSCSAMPSYFVAMAVHRGWLLKRLLRVGEWPSLAGWRRDEAQGNGGREGGGLYVTEGGDIRDHGLISKYRSMTETREPVWPSGNGW